MAIFAHGEAAPRLGPPALRASRPPFWPSAGSSPRWASTSRGARHFGIPPADGLAFPLGYALALALDAARLRWIGRVRRKDRTVDAAAP